MPISLLQPPPLNADIFNLVNHCYILLTRVGRQADPHARRTQSVLRCTTQAMQVVVSEEEEEEEEGAQVGTGPTPTGGAFRIRSTSSSDSCRALWVP